MNDLDDLFKTVKKEVNIIEVAKHLGIDVDSKGFCRCPFHDEKTASMSISEKKQYFKCFGCNKSGDAIELVKAYLKFEKPIDAVKWLNTEFNLGHNLEKRDLTPEERKKIRDNMEKIDLEKDLKNLELYTFSFLMDKISSLQQAENKLNCLPLKEKIKDENVNKFNSLLNEEMKYADVVDGFFMTNNTKDGINWVASLGKNEEEKNLRKEIIYGFVMKNKNVLTSIDAITKGLDDIKKEQEESYEDMF